MAYIVQENVCRLYANPVSFYIRGLGILGFWYFLADLELMPNEFKGMM
jgi:hypothetical protein